MTDLKTEITDDPESRGYAAMTDQQVADDLNTAYRSRPRESMSGDEVFISVASRADWDALTDTQRTQFLAFCGRETMDPFAGANVELVKSIFGDASATIANLAAARVEAITRAQELPGVRSPVTQQHVKAARAA